MATTGNRRLAAVAGLVLLVSCAAAACGRSGPPASAAGGPPATAGAGRPAAAAPRFCQSRQASVASLLHRLVPGSGRAEFVPLGASADGRFAYVAAWTAAFAGVAELDLASGRLRPISRFASASADQADGVSSGRWLVWAQTYSLTSLDRFTMYAYNASTRRVTAIGHSLAAADGTAWPSPWHAPAVSGNFAAWAQGYGPGGRVEIRLADLATGAVSTIARGYLQPPFFDGDLLVWPQSATPGGLTSLRAYRLTSRVPASLPPVLAAVHGTDFVVTDGVRTAYLSPDFTELYYSPAQDVLARPAVRLPAGAEFTDLALAPGVLAWTTSAATYLASTRTGAFVQVTPAYGYATGSSSVVLVTDAPGRKAVHAPLPTYVVDPATFDWPACTRR